MNEEMKKYARRLAGRIRNAAIEAISNIHPEIEPEGLLWTKLQILLRKYLLAEFANNSAVSDNGFYSADELQNQVRPLVMEELVPDSLPMEMQMELAMFMMQCLEEQEDFLSMYMQVLSVVQGEENLKQKADDLCEAALAQLKES